MNITNTSSSIPIDLQRLTNVSNVKSKANQDPDPNDTRLMEELRRIASELRNGGDRDKAMHDLNQVFMLLRVVPSPLPQDVQDAFNKAFNELLEFPPVTPTSQVADDLDKAIADLLSSVKDGKMSVLWMVYNDIFEARDAINRTQTWDPKKLLHDLETEVGPYLDQLDPNAQNAYKSAVKELKYEVGPPPQKPTVDAKQMTTWLSSVATAIAKLAQQSSSSVSPVSGKDSLLRSLANKL